MVKSRSLDELMRSTPVVEARNEARLQKEDENENEMDIHQRKRKRPDETMDLPSTESSHSCEIPSSDVLVLNGHTPKFQVFACAWNPSNPVLASGSHDSTARIWNISDKTCKSSLVLNHADKDRANHVHALDWNGKGTLLGTGSFRGAARIYNNNGELKSTLKRHKDAILSLKWNKDSSYILTASSDKTAIVWDAKTSLVKQQFRHHSGRVNDVDWLDNTTFASCSYDRDIHICQVEKLHPIKTFSGHQGDINCVKWNPSGRILASCSEDKTVKLWVLKKDQCFQNLDKHTEEVNLIRWCPTEPPLLASGSLDSTVMLWDLQHKEPVCSLKGHGGGVRDLAFSPNGEYLVSGDRSVHIWSVKDSKLIKSYTGCNGVTKVCWNKEGDKIAAGCTNGTVCVLDFRM